MSKLFKGLILTIFITVITLLGASGASASSFSIRLEQPKSPTNDNSFKINFVTLDTGGRPVSVKCFKKGPFEADFVQFGSDIALPAGGNSGDCEVNSSIINTQADFQFKVTAQADSDSATSSIVTVSYKTDAPGTPYNFSKERVGSCEYKIKFKTAADSGRTHKVEIYMSSFTSFSADPGTKVGEVGISSDQEGSFTTAAPDCNKTFYFAIRAFDDAGNGSGVVGDSFTTVTTTTVTPSSAPGVGGAIPVVSSQVGQGGSILGVKEATKEGEVLGEGTPSAQPTVSPEGKPNPSTPSNLFTTRNLLLAILVIITLGGIYFFRRSRE